MRLAEAEDGGMVGGIGQRPKKNSITGKRKSRNPSIKAEAITHATVFLSSCP